MTKRSVVGRDRYRGRYRLQPLCNISKLNIISEAMGLTLLQTKAPWHSLNVNIEACSKNISPSYEQMGSNISQIAAHATTAQSRFKIYKRGFSETVEHCDHCFKQCIPGMMRRLCDSLLFLSTCCMFISSHPWP